MSSVGTWPPRSPRSCCLCRPWPEIEIACAPATCFAGRDVARSMILGVRKKFLPRILKSYKELKAQITRLVIDVARPPAQ